MSSDPVKVWFRAVSTGLGFAVNGSDAHRHTDDVIQVLNLQSSSYGPFYYVNVGVALKALGAKGPPREVDCDIRVRIDSLALSPALPWP